MAEQPSFDLIVTDPDAHRAQVVRKQRAAWPATASSPAFEEPEP